MCSYQRVVDVSGCGRIRELSMFLDVVVLESCLCFWMWSYQRVVDVSGCVRIRELSMFLDVVVSESC